MQRTLRDFQATRAVLKETMLTLMIESREILRRLIDPLGIFHERWLPLFDMSLRDILEALLDDENYRSSLE